MNSDTDRSDPELGSSRPSPPLRSFSDMARFDGSTFAGSVSSPQPRSLDEKIFQDGGARQISDQDTRSPHRSNTYISGSPITYGDPSSKIWGLYLSQAGRIDKQRSENWSARTDGVLVFTGLFAAVVATFLVVSCPLLQPNSTDTTNQLLTQISQQSSSNGTGSSQPLSPANKFSFKPSASAVRVNALWFTSLAVSAGCALWATLVQQWNRRYVQFVDRPYPPSERARIRAFFADGAEKFALTAAIEVLPALLHLSVATFSIGLVDFLFNINHTVAYVFLTWIVTGVLIYLIVTIMPLLYPNSPYQTPISSICWFIWEATPLLWLWPRPRTQEVQNAISERLTKIRQGMQRALELKANLKKLSSPDKADIDALQWTLKSLDEDHELEEFLDGITGLFGNHVSVGRYTVEFREDLEKSVKPVADKLFATCSTGLFPEEPRRQRLMACLRAIWCFSGTIDRHFRAIWEQWDKVTNDPWGPLLAETWVVASNMTDLGRLNMSEFSLITALRAHFIQALMAVMWRKNRWQCTPLVAAALLQRQLGAPFVDIDIWRVSGNHQLQLAVAANLLSNALPILHELAGLRASADTALKNDLSVILDKICDNLDASDVPHELQADFAEIMNAFPRTTFDLKGSWKKVLFPVD